MTRYPSLKARNIAISKKDKAEFFAGSLENQFTLNQTKETNKEIGEAIKHLPKKKSPGRDGITNECLKNTNENIMKELAKMADGIFKFRYFPQKWKISRTIMAKKPKKLSNEATSYHHPNS